MSEVIQFIIDEFQNKKEGIWLCEIGPCNASEEINFCAHSKFIGIRFRIDDKEFMAEIS